MSQTKLKMTLGALAACVLLGTCAAILSPDVANAQSGGSQAELVAVEPVTHDFMSNVYQPTYQRLKQAMGSPEMDSATWDAVTSNALILAEGGNLLLFRGQAGESAEWVDHATSVRSVAGNLYEVAKQQEKEKSSELYRELLQNCNACHQTFAGGRPRLQP